MWISKRRYDALVRVADNNRDDAENYRKILINVRNNKISHDDVYVVISKDVYDSMSDIITENITEKQALENRIKELEAETVWYKVKYHELKQRNESDG